MEEKILGRMSRLYVTKMTKNGVYLGSYEYPELKVLLPNNQVPKGTERGDIFQVFLYKDSEDRLIATTTEPYVQLGQMARLKVTDVTGIGAFLDWGLAKDLFLPFKEQTHRVKKGEQVLAALYIDKSSRLCATMHIYDYLRTDGDFTEGDHVDEPRTSCGRQCSCPYQRNPGRWKIDTQSAGKTAGSDGNGCRKYSCKIRGRRWFFAIS